MNTLEPNNQPNNNQELPAEKLPLNLDRQVKMANKVITNMNQVGKLAFTGPTGIGKTSFIELIGKIFGLPVMTIEVPHIVEEDLLQLGFYVKASVKNPDESTQAVDVRIPPTQDQLAKAKPPSEEQLAKAGLKDLSQIEIKIGRSYLNTQLEKLRAPNEQEYKKLIQNFNDEEKQLLKEIQDTNLPNTITNIRKNFQRILFVDEYFRAASDNVAGILRDLLTEDMIGEEKLPDGTFSIFASNVLDSGIRDRIENEIFDQEVDFFVPTKDEWLAYTVSRIVGRGIKVHNDVKEAFNQSLKDEDISLDFFGDKLRVSPRRWTEMFTSINASYPFKNDQMLAILYKSIKRQFSFEGQTAEIFLNQITAMLEELAEKCKLKWPPLNIDDEEWREVLAQQILIINQSKGLIKYIPTILGMPGIGKTSILAEFETNPRYNLRGILVNCQSLNPQSVTGGILPDLEDDKRPQVSKGTPQLLEFIKSGMKKADEAYLQRLKTNPETSENWQAIYDAYTKQEFRYIILFDELNRNPDERFQNAIRKLLLEKKFNEKDKLPDKCIVVAAMNPGGNGTFELTSHMLDAITVIDGTPNWPLLLNYFERLASNLQSSPESNFSPEAATIALKLIKDFTEELCRNQSKGKLKNFYVTLPAERNAPEENTVGPYVSPRDYEGILRGIMANYDRLNYVAQQVENSLEGRDRKKFNVDEFITYGNNRLDGLSSVFIDKLTSIFRSYSVGVKVPEELKLKIETFVNNTVIKFRQLNTGISLAVILDNMLNRQEYNINTDVNFRNAWQSGLRASQFRDELEDYLKILKNKNPDNFYGNIEQIIAKFNRYKGTDLNQIKAEIWIALSTTFSEITQAATNDEKSIRDFADKFTRLRKLLYSTSEVKESFNRKKINSRKLKLERKLMELNRLEL